MSCHDIGHGLNSVAEVILEEFDAGHIPQETAFKLLMACRKGVFWCDGNELEAVECCEDRCGVCLRKDVELFEADWQKADWSKFINLNVCADCAKTKDIPLEKE